MFPIFNYGIGFNSNFPDPKPIRGAREVRHIEEHDEPVMSGNAVAAAIAALAASCAIILFAFKKGKVDSEVVVKEVRTITTDGIEAASSKIHEVKVGLEDAAARVRTRIFGDSAPVIVEPSKTVERVIVDDTVLPKAAEKTSDLGATTEKPVASTVTEPVAAAKKVEESVSSVKSTEPPAAVDKSAEPPAPIIEDKPPTPTIEDKALVSSEKPAGDASGELPSNTDEINSFVNNGLDPKADEMRDFVNNGLESQATKAADTAVSGNIDIKPPASSAPKETEKVLANGDKIVIVTHENGVENHYRYDSQERKLEELEYKDGQPIKKRSYEYTNVNGCEIRTEKMFEIVDGKEKFIGHGAAKTVGVSKPGGKPPASSASPAAPSGSARPATPLATPPKVKKQMSALDLMPPLEELPEEMLRKPLIIDGKLVSMPIHDESGKLLGCSRLERNPDGQILRNSIYDSNGKLKEWIEIDYTPSGEIKNFVFNDNMGAYVDDAQYFDKATKGNSKYNLLRNELSNQFAASTGKAPTTSGSGAPPVPPTPQAPPAPPAAPAAPPVAGTKAIAPDNAHSDTSFAQTVPASATPKPVVSASSEAKVPQSLNEFVAEYDKGANAYDKSVALGDTPEAMVELDKAMEAWGHLKNMPYPGMRELLQGRCHEKMGNYAQAIASYKTVSAFGDLQDLRKKQNLPVDVIEQIDAAIVEMRSKISRGRQSVQAAEPNPKVAQNSEVIGDLDELLAKMHEEPFEPATVAPKTPHPSEVLAETFGVNNVAPQTANAKALPFRFKDAPPDVLAEKLFGTPSPIPVKVVAKKIEQVYNEGNDIYQVAVNLYGKGNKEVAKGQFKKAMDVWMPLVEHDTDGKYLNALGQCLQGQGRYEEAIAHYEEAIFKGNTKAMLNMGAHCEAGTYIKGGRDLEMAIELYKRAGAKDNLEKMLRRDDLPKEFFEQANAALDKIKSASQEVVATSENLAGAQGEAMLN